MADAKPIPAPDGATGVLVLASGETAWGRGFGAEGQAVGEVCFHTAMTGYQEVMTDPSFAGQMVCFTFPHIGNVGANPDDIEAHDPHALGIIVREDVTEPSNFRSVERLDAWMARHGRIGLSGIDTRALTRRIRAGGAPNGVIAHSAKGEFDVPALLARARAWPGLEGMDLARDVTTATHYGWEGGVWRLGAGYGASSPLPLAGGVGGGTVPSSDDTLEELPTPNPSREREGGKKVPHVVAIDYGAKRNIYRNLAAAGATVSVLPATATYEQVMALKPDGIFLSNGPGDPAATGDYAVPVIRQLLETRIPLFGICLGHQLLALAVGASTTKMFQGHRGANHPVKRLSDGAVEITSMNHGFAVRGETLPETARETHVSLFDGSNAGFELTDRPAFSVQYHPEASPGPQDSLYLFERFVGMLEPRSIVDVPDKTVPTAIVRLASRTPLGANRADDLLDRARAYVGKRRAETPWLRDDEKIPREVASQLIRKSAWWLTHSSGNAVRAPNHSYRIDGPEDDWRLEFGANTFLIGRALKSARRLAVQAMDQVESGTSPDSIWLRRGLRLCFQKSVANVKMDLYEIYPVSTDEMVFGAQAINLNDAVGFVLSETGLADFLRALSLRISR